MSVLLQGKRATRGKEGPRSERPPGFHGRLILMSRQSQDGGPDLIPPIPCCRHPRVGSDMGLVRVLDPLQTACFRQTWMLRRTRSSSRRGARVATCSSWADRSGNCKDGVGGEGGHGDVRRRRRGGGQGVSTEVCFRRRTVFAWPTSDLRRNSGLSRASSFHRSSLPSPSPHKPLARFAQCRASPESSQP